MEDTFLVESVPQALPATTANETAAIDHDGTAEHGEERRTPPIQSACLACHGSSGSALHAREHTVGGREQCAQCHAAAGAFAVTKVHAR